MSLQTHLNTLTCQRLLRGPGVLSGVRKASNQVRHAGAPPGTVSS